MANAYRPPKAVVEERSLDGSPLAMEDIQKLYAGVSTGEALKWSRKILRQNGIIEASPTGVMLPVSVEFQLGPEILMSVTKADPDEVMDHLTAEGLIASCVPTDSGTMVLLSSPGNVEKCECDDVWLGNPRWDDATLIDTSLTHILSLVKSGSGKFAGFDCYVAEGFDLGMDFEFGDVYVLKAKDVRSHQAEVIKVDDELGLVFGWAIVSTVKGEPYFDKQQDHIPEDSMLEAAVDFMINSRVGGDMHRRVFDEDGNKLPVNTGVVVFAWPMTADIAKAFGVQTDTTGLMIAYRPHSPEMLQKFRDGTYTGFSIGGHRILDEEVVDG